jgi:hypothetical protein
MQPAYAATSGPSELPSEAEETGYQPLVATMTNAVGDRHVLAAAVHAHAQVLVTSNLRHFPNSSVQPYRIEVQSPDSFLLVLLNKAPQEMTRILREQALEFQAPPLSAFDILDRFAITAPSYAAAIRALL